MKKTLLSLVFGIAVISTAFAQQEQDKNENISTHSIAMGETVLVIAKKYKITPRDIYDYNPDAIEGITPNGVLRIPLHRQSQPKAEVAAKVKEDVNYNYGSPAATAVTPEPKTEIAATTTAPAPAPQPAAFTPQGMQTLQHTVHSGETLYSLSRKYNTTVKEIEKENASKLKGGLETGTVLNITTIPRVGDPSQYVNHNVAGGETLYSLARKYNTTVEAITEANRVTLKKGLQSGQKLTILPGNATAAPQPGDSQIAVNHKISPNGTIEHKVQNGETLMGLATKYNTTVDDITATNKNKVNSGAVQTGQILTIRNNSAISTINE